MFPQFIIVLICVAVSSGSGFQSYYVPQHQPQIVRDYYDDNAGYGRLGVHEHDVGDQRHLEHVQDIHGVRGYDHADRQALRDLAHTAHLNQGAQANLHSSGAQGNQHRQAHERDFHEKERKYAYEKGFGYERETRNRDAADNAANQASRYNHNENRAHNNQRLNALRDFAVVGDRYNRGADNYANRNALVDLRGGRNIGRDINSDYANRNQLRDVQIIPREQLRPVVIQRYIPISDDSNRFRYGMFGLGGMRGYGRGFGYNPIRYGYSPAFNSFPGEELSYYRP